MVRMKLHIALAYMVEDEHADFIFNIHAARTTHQRVVSESLRLVPPLASQLHTDPATQTRFLLLRAPTGPLTVRYDATVDIEHHMAVADQVQEVPVHVLRPEVLCYLYPSRYCPCDLLTDLALHAFGHLRHGMGRVLAIQQWVQDHIAFASNTSDAHTSALDTLRLGQGVCRDFAHVMIALCRALNIPARFATGTDFGADPRLGPPDFHAYVEVWLGHRWYLFDPSGTAIPMGLVRVGTGRDAADVAFATLFGNVRTHAPTVHADAVEDQASGWTLPVRGVGPLSTDDGHAPHWPPP